MSANWQKQLKELWDRGNESTKVKLGNASQDSTRLSPTEPRPIKKVQQVALKNNNKRPPIMGKINRRKFNAAVKESYEILRREFHITKQEEQQSALKQEEQQSALNVINKIVREQYKKGMPWNEIPQYVQKYIRQKLAGRQDGDRQQEQASAQTQQDKVQLEQRAKAKRNAPTVRNRLIKAVKLSSQTFKADESPLRKIGGDTSARLYQVVIGLDFGTAFTKVVVGEQNGKHYAVPSPVPANNHDYLLSSSFVINEEGQAHLADVLKAGEQKVSDIKLQLLNGKLDEELKIKLIIFLALVFRHTCCWLLKERKEQYQDKKIDWSINLGVATESYDFKEVVQFYKSAADVAWVLSASLDPISMETAEYYLLSLSPDETDLSLIDKTALPYRLHTDMITVIPEFLAQTKSYTESLTLERNALHLVIDIGAGTLDLTAFFTSPNDVVPILARSISPHGAEYLKRERIRLNKQVWDERLSSVPIPDSKDFACVLEVSLDDLKKHDSNFRSEVADKVKNLLNYVREKRVPSGRQWAEWKNGAPVFVCGGGSKIDLYNETIRSCLEARKHTTPCGLAKIPDLQNFVIENKAAVDLSRLYVAYGLSTQGVVFTELIKQGGVEDIELNRTEDNLAAFVSKDMV